MMREQGLLESPPIEPADFERAIANTRPSVGSGEELKRYQDWADQFGSS